MPEYDDADFSADMEPAPNPRDLSAAGERHADEISKILAETDVYVKYGLHQKAVDHLRRVFTLDPENVEAHERLKDIFVSQGREQEAEVELLKLAEVVASADPDRAEAYLHELLAINGANTGAFELARRFRLRVARMNSQSAEVEYSGGGVASVDHEADELDLASPPRPMGIARGGSPRDAVDEFDPDELIGRVAHGSPAPSRPPQRPGLDRGYADDEFVPSMSQSTRQMSPEHAAQLLDLPDDELDDPVIVDTPAPRWGASEHARAAALDAQLDDVSLGEDIDSEVASELAHGHAGGEDLPFDPDEARRFDAAVPKSETAPVYVNGFEETDVPELPAETESAGYDDEALAVSGSYDPYGTASVQTPPYDPTASHAYDTSARDHDDDQVVEHPRPETNLEEDLDNADFYAGQGMYAEALDVLRDLAHRYPNHRLINVKLAEIEALATGQEPLEVAGDSIEQELHTSSTDAIELDDIEEVAAEDLELEEEAAPQKAKKRSPTVMLEKPVEEGDAETHYDLGLAYKEMGLHDEAIKAFEKALRAPGREVNCRVMIGMCQREQGNQSEAIHQFKQGLHAEPHERERQSLYYEIGVTYEAIGDDSEALYYFEMVLKRDPSFADAANRAQRLRSRGSRPSQPDDL